MAWKELSRMESRQLFIEEWLEGEWNVAQLCRRHGISRKTGHETINRFMKHGMEGLDDRSSRPHSHPATVPDAIAAMIVQARRLRPHEGALTLLSRLQTQHPEVAWPAPSTAHEILRRSGLVRAPQQRRQATPTYPEHLARPAGANHVLSIDFKGDFVMGNGRRCYPLTVSDNYSRYLLRCVGMERGTRGHEQVRAVLETCFAEYGLPDLIRSDNGPPFASTGLLGLSRLCVWWMRLGIRPERIEPGKPQQNGRHERMHRTLKVACIPPQQNLRSQQITFDRFREDYNNHRPHQALDMRRPAELYLPSPRQMPACLQPLEYASSMLVRKVKSAGRIKLDGHEIHISDALLGEHLGLRFEDDDRHVSLWFGEIPLGTIDLIQKTRRLTPAKIFSGGMPPEAPQNHPHQSLDHQTNVLPMYPD